MYSLTSSFQCCREWLENSLWLNEIFVFDDIHFSGAQKMALQTKSNCHHRLLAVKRSIFLPRGNVELCENFIQLRIRHFLHGVEIIMRCFEIFSKYVQGVFHLFSGVFAVDFADEVFQTVVVDKLKAGSLRFRHADI